MAKKRSWGLIILGVVLFLLVVGAGLAVTAGYLLYRQFDVETVSTSTPDEEFETVIARFEGREPFIEINREGPPTVHRENQQPQPTPLSKLNVLVWEPREDRLVRFSVPFWLVRLTGGKGFTVGDRHGDEDGFVFGNVHVKVTAADLEKFGPGLIVNHQEKDGERVLVWTE